MKRGKFTGRFALIVLLALTMLLTGLPCAGAFTDAALRSVSQETNAADGNGCGFIRVSKKKKKKNSTTASSQTKSGKQSSSSSSSSTALTVEKDGSYTSKEEVALYIHTYGELPGNYITKREAEDLGWVASKGNLWDVAPGKSIGGSRFGNYEGLLPDAKGRKYFECDIDFDGTYRNAKRIIYSNDGLIYYTDDHYKSFEQLYDEKGAVA